MKQPRAVSQVNSQNSPILMSSINAYILEVVQTKSILRTWRRLWTLLNMTMTQLVPETDALNNRFGLRHFYMTGPWNILIKQASGDWSVLDQFLFFFCRVKSCRLRFLIFECVIGWYLNCMLQNHRAIVMHSRSHTPWKLTAGSPEKYRPWKRRNIDPNQPLVFWGECLLMSWGGCYRHFLVVN